MLVFDEGASKIRRRALHYVKGGGRLFLYRLLACRPSDSERPGQIHVN